MEEQAKSSERATDAPIVLIDSNMVQHFLSKKVGKVLEPVLVEIEEIGATLATSQIVVYESLKAVVFDETKFQEISEFFKRYLVRYPVNEEVLIECARVHEVYGSNPDIKGHRSAISTEDIIIGTTAMMLGAYVMTCDANDFPIPFFKEASRQHIDFEDKKRRKHITVYLLQPDHEAINAALKTLTDV